MAYTTVLTAPYQPLNVQGFFPITITATPSTLGALMAAANFTIPVIVRKDVAGGQTNRFPRHLLIQSTGGNSDSFYVTWDNATDPQSTPNPVIGWEVTPGGYVKFEDGYVLLENGEGINGTNNTAIRLVADGETAVNAVFSD